MSNHPSALPHEQFLQQYVLNRAKTVEAGFTGVAAAQEAEKTWQLIRKLTEEERSK